MNQEQARFNMIEQQIRPWNVFDDRVLSVIGIELKRENFVLPQYRNLAFSDLEIPLPGGQKMLSPKIEARLLQALNLCKTDKVLEIGCGSGFVTAALAKLTDFVYSIELDPQNKQFAADNLVRAGIKNASIIEDSGINGLSSKAPFNKIFIGGAVDHFNKNIKEQLAIGGLAVAIINDQLIMHAQLLEKISATEFKQTKLFETEVDQLIDLASVPEQFTF